MSPLCSARFVLPALFCPLCSARFRICSDSFRIRCWCPSSSAFHPLHPASACQADAHPRGGLDAAIAYVADQAGVEDYEIRTMPESQGFLDSLLDSFMGAPEEEDQLLRLSGPTAGISGRLFAEAQRLLEGADPHRSAC